MARNETILRQTAPIFFCLLRSQISLLVSPYFQNRI